jgi:hypothetical protein
MLASREAQQFWGSVAWLYPDANNVLATAPWSGDFTSRLMRNDGTLRARGLQHLHVEPITPREYVEEPFYHLELLISDEEQRRRKAVRYEVARPHLLAPGGGRINEAFYLPELHDFLKTHQVPEEDQAKIAQAMDEPSKSNTTANIEIASAIEDVPFVSLKDMDRLWEGRTIRPDAYRATIEPRERTSSMAPSEQRHLFFYVSNEGAERWPSGTGSDPPVRLSYRWLNLDESVHTAEGPRSPFLRAVNPGERILTPLHVDAPPSNGDYILEVDIVHEHVRWFGCDCRVPVHVGAPAGLPATGPRLLETQPARLRRLRRMRIPQIIHRVWLGDEQMPAEQELFGETFARHHPEWEMRLWTDANLAELDITSRERERARNLPELSNLVRYEMLNRFGGVYVDTDVECKRSLSNLLRGVDAFAAFELPGRVGNAILGSTRGHPAFLRAAQQARETLGIGPHSADANGPYFLTLILEQEPGVTIFAAEMFYPYRWDEPQRRTDSFPKAYAIHHWARSRSRHCEPETPQ